MFVSFHEKRFLGTSVLFIGALALAACEPAMVGETRRALGAAHTVYCNWEGVTLRPDYDDAARNASSIAANLGHDIVVPPFDVESFASGMSRDGVIADVM